MPVKVHKNGSSKFVNVRHSSTMKYTGKGLWSSIRKHASSIARTVGGDISNRFAGELNSLKFLKKKKYISL